jgi:hypothetical protein
MRQRRLLLHIARLDGGDLILDGEGLTRVFFDTDPVPSASVPTTRFRGEERSTGSKWPMWSP